MAYRLADGTKYLKTEIRRSRRLANGCTIFALLCIALLVRLPGFDGRALWTDELWRAALIIDPQFFHDYFLSPSVETAITSPLYALFVKALALFAVSPVTLRLSSLIPGLLSVAMAFALTRKAGGNIALGILAGLVFALNPIFVAYSNEMKPYMFEVFVHLACLLAWLTLLMMPRPTIRAWALYFLVLSLTILSTPTAIFLLPGSGMTLFVRFLVSKRDKYLRVKNLAICVFGFLTIGLFVAALYYFAWRHGSDGDMLSIWADGFVAAKSSYMRFFGAAFPDMWRAAFNTGLNLPKQAALAFAAFVVALAWTCITGNIVRAPTRSIMLFYVLFLGTLCLVNFVKIWPLGALRTNLFIYGHLIIFLFLLTAQVQPAHLAARIILVLIPVFFLLHAHSANGRAQYRAMAARLHDLAPPVEQTDLIADDFSYRGKIGATIAANCSRQKTLIFADSFFGSALAYYSRYDTAHMQGVKLLSGKCVNLVPYPEAYSSAGKMEAIVSQNIPQSTGAWFIYDHLGPIELAKQAKIAEKFGKIVQTTSYDGAGYFFLVTNRRPAPLKASP